MSKRNASPWVVAGGAPGELCYCQNCGKGLPIAFPQMLTYAVAAMTAFCEEHARCTTKTSTDQIPVSPQQWAAGRDTGNSSMTIYSVMMGVPIAQADVPHDPDDFGRCYRLLQLFPAWKTRLDEVAARYPIWGLLVREWAALEALYEEALRSDSGEALYKQWDGRPRSKRHRVCQSGRCKTGHYIMTEASQMKVKTVGIDLAKNVFQVHGVDEDGKVVLRKQLRRSQVMEFFAQRPPCLVGMEACGSAHHWARRLMKIGYAVKLMAPQFVKPYVKTNKNDAADAEAICEAVSRPTMRFVPVKTVDQQAALSVHRARQGFVQQRTAQANQIRGLLAEYGVVIPQGIGNIRKCLPEILEDAENSLPCLFRQLLGQLGEHLKALDQMVKEMDHQIQQWHGNNEASQRLAAIAGVGPITASAMVASVGDARNFRNGRQLAAWLGLVPRQHSTGGKSLLLGISKRGDCYLRTLLIHGARSVIRCSGRKAVGDPGDKTTWLQSLVLRRGTNVAAVALANKNARVIWALLARDRHYQRSAACLA